MSLREVLRTALASLYVHKMRSFLTLLGIVIGIASVIAVTAMGTGAQRAVEERMAQLGTTLIQVSPQWVRQAGVQTADRKPLTPEDAEMIRRRSPSVVQVQIQQDRNLPVTFLNRNTRVQVVGTSSNFLTVRNYRVARGRMFTEGDEQRHRRVAVLGASVLEEMNLVLPEQILGRLIRIGGAQFEVIGVLAPKGRTSSFGDPDDMILVPFSTGRILLFGSDRVNDIHALAASDEQVDQAMAEITLAMRRSHRLRAGAPDDFRVRHETAFLEAMEESTQVFGLLLAGIATVSLLVGGIGIMNIMLVSVTERTREIGIRKAMGATRRTIMLQFLTEAMVLCLVGGALGIVIGAITSSVLRVAFGWNTDFTLLPAAIAFAFAGAIGILFGVWPARRAAVLDPITALRYE